jgi:hypothetical protein
VVPGQSTPLNSAVSKLAVLGRARRQDTMRGGDKARAPVGDNPQEVLAHEIKLQRDEDDDDDGDEQVTICHKGKNTLSISPNAWPAHEAHGDTLGACS